jgi:hypothetical protein
MTETTPRRALLAAALGAAAAGLALPAVADSPAAAAGRAGSRRAGDRSRRDGGDDAPVDYHAWICERDWSAGEANGTRVVPGPRPGIVIDRATGSTAYTDPHTKTTATWETACWTSPERTLPHPATELVSSWNADTPPGTWIQVELTGTYTDGTTTPWYVMGRWASGDADIKRTSVDDQSDGMSSIWTDTFSIDNPGTGLRLACYRLRVTLLRRPGTSSTPTVWRIGAMASDIPDRFTVPASVPGVATGHELQVPRYSQELHKGQYPQYDNGGEAWCSPTSSEMAVEYWGRRPTAADLSWVDPSYADPQVCQAARYTYDYQYEGCGNWPFNAAYAASYHDMNAIITRLHGLPDVETLIRAGIPVITSQSFLATELDGAGYGTSGHLMCVAGFTADGDVVVNDPASADDDAVRHVYKRSQFETVWLRTKRYNASGAVVSGTGGVAYLYWPVRPTPAQCRALESLGIR